MFISFEGIDGSGKTTRIAETAAALRERGYRVLTTREPGGTAAGDAIRQILLSKDAHYDLLPRAELLLFCASRAQLVGQVIQPWLDDGGVVLCDRYADSTLAYQGYGHGLDLNHLRQILNFATGGLYPKLTVYLDLDPKIGLERRRQAQLFQGEDFNRLDSMQIAFHERVYAGYEQLIAATPERWQRVDADQTPETVQAAIMTIITNALQQELPQRG